MRLVSLLIFILLCASGATQTTLKNYIYPQAIHMIATNSKIEDECFGVFTPYLIYRDKEISFNHFGDIYSELLLNNKKIKLLPGDHQLILKSKGEIVDSVIIHIDSNNQKDVLYPEFEILKCCKEDKGRGLKFVIDSLSIISSDCNSIEKLLWRIKENNNKVKVVAVHTDSISLEVAQKRLELVKSKLLELDDSLSIKFETQYFSKRLSLVERGMLIYLPDCEPPTLCEWGIILAKDED